MTDRIVLYGASVQLLGVSFAEVEIEILDKVRDDPFSNCDAILLTVEETPVGGVRRSGAVQVNQPIHYRDLEYPHMRKRGYILRNRSRQK